MNGEISGLYARPKRIYLAARYSRRLELRGYRDQLEKCGHTVNGRWLDGAHQIDRYGLPIGDHGEALVEGGDEHRAAELRLKLAIDHFREVVSSEILVAFTEPPAGSGGRNRGGRHVELGIALGRGMKVWVVGCRENLFTWLDGVQFFPTWDEAFERLNLSV